MCATVIILEEGEMLEIINEIRTKYKDVPIEAGDVYYKHNASVLSLQNGEIIARPMFWSFPLEREDKEKGKKKIIYNYNARVENIRKIKEFREAYPIIVPVNGFYEWGTTRHTEKKQRFAFHDPAQELTYLAGLCNKFDINDGFYEIRFTVITLESAGAVKAIEHTRMPAVIKKSDVNNYLSIGKRISDIEHFIQSNSPDLQYELVNG